MLGLIGLCLWLEITRWEKNGYNLLIEGCSVAAWHLFLFGSRALKADWFLFLCGTNKDVTVVLGSFKVSAGTTTWKAVGGAVCVIAMSLSVRLHVWDCMCEQRKACGPRWISCCLRLTIRTEITKKAETTDVLSDYPALPTGTQF